ncbi:MAG: excinuclease ABC subunit UvrC [Deltaproteobacteria bacterium]|nr:excinuclease ABC subunit UvrC [Deltaproteobacteria bacterium]
MIFSRGKIRVKPVRFEISNITNLATIPSVSGVYLFRDPKDTVLYIGKARDLRQRLASYLRSGSFVLPKTGLIMKLANSFEIIITANEKEALILEALLIKEHRPKYNVVLRDDKAYPFLKLDIKKPFPRLSVVRRRAKDGALYFGPYPSARAVRETLRSISSLFRLRACSDRSMRTRVRACLLHQIGRCSAPCVRAISEKDYADQVRQVKLFLKGRTGPLLKILRSQMEEASEALEYEKAAILRDQIYAIKKVFEKQSIVAGMYANWDIIGLARSGDASTLAVLKVRDGVVQGQEVHHLSRIIEETDQEILSVFIRQFYQQSPVPKEIILPEDMEDSGLISEWLFDMVGRTVLLRRPARGLKCRLLEMAKTNAGQTMLSFERQHEAWRKKAGIMMDILNLKYVPEKVEGVDISITGGELPVGSLVAFYRGQPNKKDYRHYNIRGVRGTDDYAMIREVMLRRIVRGKEKGNLPDLFLIDGGRGQLRQAFEVADSEGLLGEFDLVALAKEIKDEGEKIFRPGWSEPLILPRHHPVLLFLQQVRDEAHRFGINFHRKRRDAKRLRSRLSEISGVGPKRQQALLKYFGSLTRVRQASSEEINKVPGISKELARTIHEHLSLDQGTDPIPSHFIN